MNTSFSRKQLSLAVTCALVLGFASGAVQAANYGLPNEREIWTDNPAAQVWMNGYGECWHSAFGPPPGYNTCNPAPVAQYVAPAPAPYVAPAPAPVQYVAPVVQPEPVIERPRKKDRN